MDPGVLIPTDSSGSDDATAKRLALPEGAEGSIQPLVACRADRMVEDPAALVA